MRGWSLVVDYAEVVSAGDDGLESIASIKQDGRISVKFDLKQGTAEIPHDHAEPVKEFAVDSKWRDCPSINIVIMIVGSRGVYSIHFYCPQWSLSLYVLKGDVQPYVALGQQLEKDGHRVRIATHETFREFVCASSLDFFSIGGDPQDLMSYMVKSTSRNVKYRCNDLIL